MKYIITLLLFFWGVTWLSAQNIDQIKVSGKYEDKSLMTVLLDLEIKYQLKFEYDGQLIKDVKVNGIFKKQPLEEALRLILTKAKIDFEIQPNKTITLMPLSEAPQIDWSTVKPTRKDFDITGVVRDRKTGEALPFSNILVYGTTNGATTNVDGYFTLFNVPSDTVLLLVSYIGYQEKIFRVTPESDVSKLEILLDNFDVELEEVVVHATKKEQMVSATTGVSRIGMTPTALAKLPSYGEKDIFRSLQLLPGVSGSNESSSGLYVRGGTPDQNLVLFDGFTVYHVDHLFGFFSAFNTNAIKDVQLYKGGFDAKYGGRLSSVVDLTGKEGNTEQYNMGLGVSLLSVNGFVESPFANSKGSILVAGRRSFKSSFYTNIFDAYTNNNSNENPARGRFAQQNVEPNTYFYDLNGKVTYRPSQKDVVSLSFYSGQDNLDNSRNIDDSLFKDILGDDFDFSFSQQNTDLTAWGNWGSSAKWSRRWNNRLYTNTNLSYSNYYSERNRSNSTRIEQSDTTIIRNRGSYEFNDLKDISLKVDNEFKITQNNQFDFGVHSTWNDIEYQFVQNDTTQVLNREDQGVTATIYVQDKQTIADKLVLKGGLRSTYYSPTNKMYWEPRAALSYIASDHIKLKAAWGIYNQFANRIVREDIQQGSRDFWILANDETAPVSSSVHHILGASYETNKWLFDVEGYYKTMDGLSEYSTRFISQGIGPNREINYEEFFYQGSGIAKGIEFLVQRKAGKLTGWLGYTLGEVKYDFEAFGATPFLANQDVTHELKLVGMYKIGRFDLGATFVYATGKPYTAPIGYYELELLDGSTSDFFEVSDKNALRYEDYHRLDISATYNLKLGKENTNIGLSLSNLYNRKNTWYKEYEVIEGELLETNVSLLGFTPSLFFNWTLH